uniref:Uncharacterized protein n=1 Tax=Ignisphaera aggregans TaxID=334771 RepID=A0A7C4FI59_9CREN
MIKIFTSWNTPSLSKTLKYASEMTTLTLLSSAGTSSTSASGSTPNPLAMPRSVAEKKEPVSTKNSPL